MFSVFVIVPVISDFFWSDRDSSEKTVNDIMIIEILHPIFVLTIAISGIFIVWAGLYIIINKFICKFFSGEKKEKK